MKALVAEIIPVTKPKETIKEIKVVPNITPKNESLELFKDNSFELKSEMPLSETRYEIKFSVTKEIFDKVQLLKCKFSNKLGSDLSMENVFTELINKSLSTSKTEKGKPSNKNSRYLPVALKREILNRDNLQCSYISPDGTRCTQKHYLNFDHIQPSALGGKSIGENLRVLCSAHNQMFARMTFGERAN